MFKQLVQLVLVAVRRDVEVFGEVEVRPQSFLEDCDDPNAQVVLLLAINPFRGLNEWLHPIFLHKGDRLGKSLSICDVFQKAEEIIGVLYKFRRNSESVSLVFVVHDPGVLDNGRLELSHRSVVITVLHVHSVRLVRPTHFFEDTLARILMLTSSSNSLGITLALKRLVSLHLKNQQRPARSTVSGVHLYD